MLGIKSINDLSVIIFISIILYLQIRQRFWDRRIYIRRRFRFQRAQWTHRNVILHPVIRVEYVYYREYVINNNYYIE